MHDRHASVRRVLIGVLIANVAVVSLKFTIGVGTGSLAVLGDGVHASVDALNNIIGLAVMRVAAVGPDADHPYGHGKFETLGALVIVGFLSVSCFELVTGAIRALLAGGRAISAPPLALAALGGTLIINVVVATYESARGHALRSEILLADAAHTRADVVITAAVLAGLVAAGAGYSIVDPLLAMGVAGFVLYIAWRIVRRSVPVLVDERALPAAQIRYAAEEVAGVQRAYSIKSRGSGLVRFAELTIAVDGQADVRTAHAIADEVEMRLTEALGLSEVVVHVEPL
jgi:cation diffusion facilitator family transporter